MFEFFQSVKLHIQIIAVATSAMCCSCCAEEGVAAVAEGRSFIQVVALGDRARHGGGTWAGFDFEENQGGGGNLDGAGDGDAVLSFTQVGPSNQNGPGYRAADYQPQTWQGDLDRLRAEAQALKRDLSMVPPDQREYSQSLMLRLADVNQQLAQFSAPPVQLAGAGQEAGRPPPQNEEAVQSGSQGPAQQVPATAASTEDDPSAYLALPPEVPHKGPPEDLPLPVESSPQSASTSRLPPSDVRDSMEASNIKVASFTSPSAVDTANPVAARASSADTRELPQREQMPRTAISQNDLADRGGAASMLFRRNENTLVASRSMDRAGGAQVGPSHIRPNAATGNVDVVNFGLYLRTLYGLDLKHHVFTVDVLLQFQWLDARAVSLIPAGQTSITLSDEDAQNQLWLPDVEITNRDIGAQSHKLVSTSIGNDGIVKRTERSLASIRHKFLLEHYPFDEQMLAITVASAMYTASELKLSPVANMSGLSPHLLDGEIYKVVDFHSSEYEDTDGALTKSLGYLEFRTERSTDKFIQTFLVPMIFCILCSFGVFWLPHTPMFITPRMALSVLMLLVFRNVAAVGSQELPEGAPYNWYDLLCMNVQLNMGLVICWNIFIETASQGMNCNTTGRAVNNEMKAVAPLLAISTFGVIFAGAGPNSALNLPSVALIVFFVVIFVHVIYIGCVASTLAAEKAHNEFLGKRGTREVSFNDAGTKPEMC